MLTDNLKLIHSISVVFLLVVRVISNRSADALHNNYRCSVNALPMLCNYSTDTPQLLYR
jgi:hypothetical protein